jgi:DNA replication protein DnaC
MRSSGSVPTRFAGKLLRDLDPVSASVRKAAEAADQFVGGAISGLVLVGPPGCGKTHVAAGIVNEITRREREAYEEAAAVATDRMPRIPVLPVWANVADLIVELRLDMDRARDDRQAVTLASNLRTHPSVAVLDDLGREKGSDWTAETIYAIVNSRYEQELPTIITSNLTPETLQASTYWTAISRVAEDGRLIAFRDTPDRRLRRA